MVQVQSYRGYFKDGQFMSPFATKLPENVEVVVTVIGDPVLNNKSEQEAVRKFLVATKRINEEGFCAQTLESFEMWDRGEFRLDFEERQL